MAIELQRRASLGAEASEQGRLQKRMAQFFHHYLKGEPMPVWMKEGFLPLKRNLRSDTEVVLVFQVVRGR
ncbi:MAG: hypothetical protein R2758_02760 [Bacteroidales bacterium]